ncbi:MAG: helix-turn-helix transcriptional regulator [Bacteroidota bacterium]
MPNYNRIKAVLAEKGKTSKWLSEQIDRDKSTVSRWCTNDMQPSLEILFKIAELLDIEARELLVKRK